VPELEETGVEEISPAMPPSVAANVSVLVIFSYGTIAAPIDRRIATVPNALQHRDSPVNVNLADRESRKSGRNAAYGRSFSVAYTMVGAATSLLTTLNCFQFFRGDGYLSNSRSPKSVTHPKPCRDALDKRGPTRLQTS
jgi:hypothetical protein